MTSVSILSTITAQMQATKFPSQRLLMSPQGSVIEDIWGQKQLFSQVDPYYQALREQLLTAVAPVVCNHSQAVAWATIPLLTVVLPLQPAMVDESILFLKEKHQEGNNILLTGPQWPTLAVALALSQDAVLPVLLSPLPLMGPPPMLTIDNSTLLAAVDADSIVIFASTVQQLAQAMTQYSNVVGILDAGRLDRALMRFERAASSNPASAPLHVLAGIDWVGVWQSQPQKLQARVLAEIVLTDTGYQPKIVNISPVEPTTAAAVAVASDTTWDLGWELTQATTPQPEAVAPLMWAPTAVATDDRLSSEAHQEPVQLSDNDDDKEEDIGPLGFGPPPSPWGPLAGKKKE